MMPQQIPEVESPEDFQKRIYAMIKKSKGPQLFCIPNDEEGQDLLAALRKHLNKKDYSIRCKGRGNRQGIYEFKSALPIDESEWIAIYIKLNNKKTEEVILKRTKAVRKYMEQILHTQKEIHGRLRARNTDFNNLKKEYNILEINFNNLKDAHNILEKELDKAKRSYILMETALAKEIRISDELRWEVNRLKNTISVRATNFLDRLWKFLHFHIHISITKPKDK